MRVLIVDDSDLIRCLVREMLAPLPLSMDIEEASDVPNAIRILRRWEPDVITLDLQLPGGSGLDVLRAIKEAGLCSAVIVITSLQDTRVQQACLDTGALCVLEKPSDMERLPDILRTIMESRRTS